MQVFVIMERWWPWGATLGIDCGSGYGTKPNRRPLPTDHRKTFAKVRMGRMRRLLMPLLSGFALSELLDVGARGGVACLTLSTRLGYIL